VSEDAASFELAEVSVAGYRLIEVIGRGSVGTVYLARAEDDLGRAFAVKVFPAAGRGAYARELETLRAVEAVRAAAGAAGLVETIQAREADGQGVVVMQYVEGGDLETRVRRDGPLPAEAAVDLLLPVLDALALLHREGLVHKDVKPANVLVGDDGRARLGDFGLTRSLEGPLSSAGTPGFCAPEVYSGAPVEGRAERVDVYSAAATLYFLLTGRAPLPGRPDLFALERARVDRALQDVLFTALAEDPERRLESAVVFARDLRRWRAGELPDPSSRAGRRRVAVGAVAVAVALVAVVGVGLARLGSPGPEGAAAATAPAGGPEPAGTSAPAAGRSAPLVAAPAGPSGPRWSGGRLRPDAARPSAAALGLAAAPAAWGWDAGGGVWIAADARGAAAVVRSPPGGAPGPAARWPAPDPPAGPDDLVLVAAAGPWAARLVVRPYSGEADRVEVRDLRTGRAAGAVACPPATALALALGEPPTVVVGTPDGRVVVAPLAPGAEPRAVRTHADEVLDLLVDPDRGLLLVAGDDRRLRRAGELGPGAVRVGDVGLAARPRLRLKALDLAAALRGEAVVRAEGPVDAPLALEAAGAGE